MMVTRGIVAVLASTTALLFVSASAVAQTVNITGLSDISLASMRPANDVREVQFPCVYSNIFGNGYLVTARGSGPGGTFQLAGAGVSDLPFSVEWNDQPNQRSGTTLSPGLPLGGQTSNASDPACGTGPTQTASLIVTLASRDLYAASGGITYSGTLSFTIAPQ